MSSVVTVRQPNSGPRRQEQWPEWNYARRPVFPDAKRSQVQRRWQRNIPRRNPDEVQAAARARVTRLEEALKVLGEDDSTEVRGLQAALQEARRAAQDRPMAAQIEECQAFIERSQRRLARLEEEQAKEQEQLDAAQRRMARFREEMAGQCHQPHRRCPRPHSQERFQISWQSSIV